MEIEIKSTLEMIKEDRNYCVSGQVLERYIQSQQKEIKSIQAQSKAMQVELNREISGLKKEKESDKAQYDSTLLMLSDDATNSREAYNKKCIEVNDLKKWIELRENYINEENQKLREALIKVNTHWSEGNFSRDKEIWKSITDALNK